jgi:uncharacterized protein YkwD
MRWVALTLLFLAVAAGVVLLRMPDLRPAPAALATATAAQPPPSAPPKASARPALRDNEAEVAPGEAVTVELMEPPASQYADPPRSGPDLAYAAVVEKIGRRDVTYDPLLGRAARELAFQQSIWNDVVQEDVVAFILRASGAADRTVTQGYAATNGDGMEPARAQIEKVLAVHPGEPARVGVGEVWVPGAKLHKVISVLVSLGDQEIRPASRRVERGGRWELSGTLPRGFHDPSALAHWPDGRFETVPVTGERGQFHVLLPAGDSVGTLTVCVGAVGPHGPRPIVQLPVEVGRDPPDTYDTRVLPDESTVRAPAQAEALVFDLLNADRRRAGLPALARDTALDAIARAHSTDMRDTGFFGHVSPKTGSPRQRIEAAGYKASSYGENVASGGHVHEMQRGLYDSLSHRRSILDPRMTKVGIGVALGTSYGRPGWQLTQLFAAPAEAD